MTRAIITAITQGQLEKCPSEHLELLNLDIPRHIDGVDSAYLNPRNNWADPSAYDSEARKLAALFVDNIKKFAPSQAILNAGPQALT